MDPLYNLKGIIYMIENKVNGRRYIGQTIFTFARRYPSCNWWKNSNNPFLKAAVAKYGPEAFAITILEHSKTLEELNILEAQYAKKWNTYAPNGYNLVECGKNRRQHPSSILLRSRTVTLNDPDGQDITITNIRKFCLDNGLDYRTIYRVLNGKFASHRGWTLQGVTTKHIRTNHCYRIYDHNGVLYEIIGLAKFCKEKGLNYYHMRSMVQGKIFESQGYALSVEAFSKRRMRHVVTLVRGKEELIIRNIKQECKNLGFHSRFIYQLIAGKILSYKGWAIKALSEVPVHS